MIVDRFSKEIIPIACTTELSSEGWAKILRDEVYAKHGMPQVVISDRGTVFVSKFMKDLYDLLQIKANASTAYHPQTDGQTERVNQEVEKYLRIFVNHLQDDWVEWLSLAAFAHNNRVHSATGKKPPSRLTTAITLKSSLAPNPRHRSGHPRPPLSFQKCRKSTKRPNELWKKPLPK